MEEAFNPFISLYNTMVFDSRDWSKDMKNAWMYGIVVGWLDEDGNDDDELFKEFNGKFGWDKFTWCRLQSLHREFAKYQEMFV